MIFIGDVHGKYKQYKRILKACTNSIQVGDMGVGFRRTNGMGLSVQNPPHAYMVKGNHRFIRGNHDNPAACSTHSQWIADGSMEGDTMFIGGGVSIDKEWRTPGYDWWEDEELDAKGLYFLAEQYIKMKPRVMVTHDCPEEVAAEVARLAHRIEKLDPRFNSRTRTAFQQMWSAHSPELWVFGHWHCSFDHVLRGTRFVCLNELEVRDL